VFAYRHFIFQNSHPIYVFIAHETALQCQLQKDSTPMVNSGLTSTQTLIPMPITPITLDCDMPMAFATGPQASHVVPLIGSLASILLSVPIKLELPPKNSATPGLSGLPLPISLTMLMSAPIKLEPLPTNPTAQGPSFISPIRPAQKHGNDWLEPSLSPTQPLINRTSGRRQRRC